MQRPGRRRTLTQQPRGEASCDLFGRNEERVSHIPGYALSVAADGNSAKRLDATPR
jgi:hypothetical protein